MHFTQITNPKWVNAAHTAADCMVTFDGLGTVPFTADSSDPLPHVQAVFAAIAAGEAGPVAEYVEPPPAPPAPPPAVPVDPATVQTSAGDFYDRFTEAEQVAIATAAQANPVVRVWVDRLLVRQNVVFSDPRLSAGMDALVAAGLITQARSEVILPLKVRSSGVTPL